MTQVPLAENETVEPEIEHTPALDASTEKTTASPDEAVAVTVYGGSCLSAFGAVEVNVIVCDARAIVNDCCTCAAAR